MPCSQQMEEDIARSFLAHESSVCHATDLGPDARRPSYDSPPAVYLPVSDPFQTASLSSAFTYLLPISYRVRLVQGREICYVGSYLTVRYPWHMSDFEGLSLCQALRAYCKCPMVPSQIRSSLVATCVLAVQVRLGKGSYLTRNN